jgi:hypothetical protein
MVLRDRSFDKTCPFARLATELLAHAHELDPSRPPAPVADVAAALVASAPGALPQSSPREIEQLFQSLDIMPFSAARLDSIE